MEIRNTDDALEFLCSWEGQFGEKSMLALAIEGLERCDAIMSSSLRIMGSRSRYQQDEIDNNRAAIALIRARHAQLPSEK
jgi:hypothetical protein